MPSLCLIEIDIFGIEHKATVAKDPKITIPLQKIGWIPIEEIAKGDVSKVFKVLSASDGNTTCAMKVEKLGKNAETKNIEKDVLAAFHDDPLSLQLVDYCSVGRYRCTMMSLAGPDFSSIRTLVSFSISPVSAHPNFSDGQEVQ